VAWPRGSPRRLQWRWPRWRGQRHREGEGVLKLEEGPLLLLADEDGHRELLLLSELGRYDDRLAKLGRLEVVVHDVVDHVIRIVADHPAVVDLTGDLAWWPLVWRPRRAPIMRRPR
jgi:hypothetical protein